MYMSAYIVLCLAKKRKDYTSTYTWVVFVRILGPLWAAHISNLKNLKLTHVHGRIWSCSLVLKFSPTLLVGAELYHYI